MTIQIIQGDCREVLRTLPPGSVDVCITDPPYNETSLHWDKNVEGWPEEVGRVLKPSGTLWCFGSMRFFLGTYAFADWQLVQDLVWEKHNGSNPTKDRFRRVHELMLQFRPLHSSWADIYKDPQTTPDAVKRRTRRTTQVAHWGKTSDSIYASEDGGPRQMRSVIYCRSCQGHAIHPTQKPVALLEPLVRYSCPPGGAVLDCFSGSGSTGIAAERTGRDAILIDLNQEYCDMARRRVDQDAPLFNQSGKENTECQ